VKLEVQTPPWQGPGELASPSRPPFHAPRFAGQQSLGYHGGWSWPRSPLRLLPAAAKSCSPSWRGTCPRRSRWQKVSRHGLLTSSSGTDAVGGCGERRAQSLCGLLCWSGSEPGVSLGSHAGFCCVSRACAMRRGVERSCGSSEQKTGRSARQKCKSQFGPNSPGFLSVWMESFGLQGQMSLVPGLGA